MHYLNYKPSGAVCSCGKDFNCWAWPRTQGRNAHQMKGLARGQAKRHADRANEREAQDVG